MNVLMNNLLVAYEDKENFSPSNIYYEKIKEIRMLLHHNPNQDQTIESLSEKIGISSSHFQHLYTQLFGISFQKDLIRMRIDYACNSLLTTNLSIEAIAELCGYSNTVHFYRQFKQMTGVTPTKYRQQNNAAIYQS